MAVAWDAESFLEVFRGVRATASALFGDRRVYVERYVPRARHVEAQVLCDRYGGAVHLGERECSVQRRRQKLIEESPAPSLPPEVTERMCAVALQGVKAVGYEGVGTVEFVVDEHGDFFFTEVNCRIQVEHPVTELVTGIDLVREQMRLAAGEPLGYTQDDVVHQGSAVECRVNAEDPSRHFAPTPGRLDEFVPPGGPFVRVDTHAYPGYQIPAEYDSLLAKVISWAPDRDRAIARVQGALAEFSVGGERITTTIGFLTNVLDSRVFRAGTYDTGLVDDLLREEENHE